MTKTQSRYAHGCAITALAGHSGSGRGGGKSESPKLARNLVATASSEGDICVFEARGTKLKVEDHNRVALGHLTM